VARRVGDQQPEDEQIAAGVECCAGVECFGNSIDGDEERAPGREDDGSGCLQDAFEGRSGGLDLSSLIAGEEIRVDAAELLELFEGAGEKDPADELDKQCRWDSREILAGHDGPGWSLSRRIVCHDSYLLGCFAVCSSHDVLSLGPSRM